MCLVAASPRSVRQIPSQQSAVVCGSTVTAQWLTLPSLRASHVWVMRDVRERVPGPEPTATLPSLRNEFPDSEQRCAERRLWAQGWQCQHSSTRRTQMPAGPRPVSVRTALPASVTGGVRCHRTVALSRHDQPASLAERKGTVISRVTCVPASTATLYEGPQGELGGLGRS